MFTKSIILLFRNYEKIRHPNSSIIFLPLLSLFTIFTTNASGLIGQEVWSNSMELDIIGVIHANQLGDDFKNTTLLVKDGKFGTPKWESINSTKRVENRLKVEATDVYRNYFIEDGEYFLDLKVEFWQADDDPYGPPCVECTMYEKIKIIVDGNSITTSYRQYENAHKMKVTVLNSPDLSKAPSIRIGISVFVERFY